MVKNGSIVLRKVKVYRSIRYLAFELWKVALKGYGELSRMQVYISLTDHTKISHSAYYKVWMTGPSSLSSADSSVFVVTALRILGVDELKYQYPAPMTDTSPNMPPIRVITSYMNYMNYNSALHSKSSRKSDIILMQNNVKAKAPDVEINNFKDLEDYMNGIVAQHVESVPPALGSREELKAEILSGMTATWHLVSPQFQQGGSRAVESVLPALGSTRTEDLRTEILSRLT